MTHSLRQRVAAARADPILVNAALMFATTLSMAFGGAVFWVVAARLHSPATVGLAGSLVSAADSLALFAQLGLNVALVRTLPGNRHQAADVATATCVVGLAGAAFALGYCLLVPLLAPELGAVLGSPWAVAAFCALVAFAALNALSGSVYLGLDRVRAYFAVNGVLLLVLKVGLPFLAVGVGALALYGAAGLATALCALASLVVISRLARGRASLRPSPRLREARGFAGAAYLVYVLHVVPHVVLPLLVIDATGAAAGGVFFISFQVVTLQNAVLLAVANSTYAEAEKARTGRHALVARGARTMGLYALVGVAAMLLVAPWLLAVFGSHYADEATATLRVLSLSTLATAFHYWVGLRLRMSRHHRAMVLVQAASTVAMLGLAVLAAPHGPVWVAAAYGGGHLVGGVVGLLATTTVARFGDDAPEAALDEDPDEEPGEAPEGGPDRPAAQAPAGTAP